MRHWIAGVILFAGTLFAWQGSNGAEEKKAAPKQDLNYALREVIKHDEDQVLFVTLGPAEGRGDRVITALGRPYVNLDAPCLVV